MAVRIFFVLFISRSSQFLASVLIRFSNAGDTKPETGLPTWAFWAIGLSCAVFVIGVALYIGWRIGRRRTQVCVYLRVCLFLVLTVCLLVIAGRFIAERHTDRSGGLRRRRRHGEERPVRARALVALAISRANEIETATIEDGHAINKGGLAWRRSCVHHTGRGLPKADGCAVK